MPSSRTKSETPTPSTTDLQQFKDLLLWCRANQFSLGDVAVGSIRATVLDLGVGQNVPRVTGADRDSMYEAYGGAAMAELAASVEEDEDET